MKRIAFLTERMRLGFGTDLCIHELARRLRTRFDVKVFACVDDGTYRGHGYDILRYRTPHVGQGWEYERNVLRSAHELLPHRIDLLIPVTFPFFGVPSRLHIPALAYDHGVVPSRGLPLRLRLLVEYMRVANKYWHARAAAVVAPSRFLVTTFSRFSRHKTHVVPNGADHIHQRAPLPPREELRRRRGIGPDDVVFGFVGRLDLGTPYKGVSELVESFQRLRARNDRVHMVMRGFGTPEAEAQLYFQGIDVRSCVPARELQETLHMCDVFVTATHWEGFNLPLVEAQAMGRPCIAYAIGAHPEVVGPGGFLVRTQQEFVAAMERLAADHALRTSMGEAAAAWATRFSWERAATTFGDVVEAVLA